MFDEQGKINDIYLKAIKYFYANLYKLGVNLKLNLILSYLIILTHFMHFYV